MKIKMLFLALRAKGLVIDIITADNRTFQLSGDRRFQGMYEMQWAFDQAREIRLWTGPTEYRMITKSELESELTPFPVR